FRRRISIGTEGDSSCFRPMLSAMLWGTPMAKPATTLGDDSAAIVESGREARPDGRAFSGVLLIIAALGIAYFAVLLLTDLLNPLRLRFPIPYAVPIFDTPFALVALGVGYLCLERHRLRHD